MLTCPKNYIWRGVRITIREGRLLANSVEKLLFFDFRTFPAETWLNKNNELHPLNLLKLIEFTKETSFSIE